MNRLMLLHALTVAVVTTQAAEGGETIKMTFTGIVNTVTEGGPADFPAVGDPVAGEIRYDLNSVDVDPMFDTGRYAQSIAGGFYAQVGSRLFSYDDYSVNVFNRVPGAGPWDAFSVGSNSNTPFTGVGFQGVNRDIFSSSSLPESLDLSELLPIDAAGVIFDDRTFRIDFTLLSLKVVPEPTSHLLTAIGAACIAAFGLRPPRN